MSTWQLQPAKTHLSKVIERALTQGPQTMTRHGKARAALAALRPDFRAYLLGGPKVDDFPIARDPDTGRNVDLESFTS